MTPLEPELRRLIAIDGPLDVARYVALCLGHPLHGYYMARDPLGRAGDFVTAPEVSQMFGELIGLWAAATWQAMGAPAPLRLIELGPGHGTLMADALRAANILPEFRAALAVHLVETSPRLIARQRETLPGLDIPLAWHRDLGEVPEGPAIIIANEFFDALPLHQAVKTPRGWHGRMVGVANNRLAFALSPDPMPAFERVLPDALHDAPVGAIYEWRDDHVAAGLAERLVRDGGAALVIDYGHTESAAGDTLQAVQGHRFADPLAEPGLADLTAHVDFAALARTAEREGARTLGPVTQGAFLHRLGIVERATALKANATKLQAADIDAALLRLTGGGGEMGELFKVLAIADPKLDTLPGFDT
jgi:NADH dehydrogenase [ubiquinone] 1 alpha subcomplex assembly factor 7